MILSLYCMVICFCTFVVMQVYNIGNVSLLVLAGGIFFLLIANYRYDKTIDNLKKEIKELKNEIETIKAEF